MSDTYYRNAAERRRARWLAAGLILAVLGALALGTHALFYDACTRSYARTPDDVVRAYATALRGGDLAQAQECWQHQTYYDLEAGCSEVCLSRFAGATFDIVTIQPSEPQRVGDRAAARVTIELACPDNTTHTGEVVLDGVRTALPWRHWAIIHSTLGGTIAQAWCR